MKKLYSIRIAGFGGSGVSGRIVSRVVWSAAAFSILGVSGAHILYECLGK